MTDRANHEAHSYAGLVVGEMVNSLEAANNTAYLLSVSSDDPASIVRYVEILQDQLGVLNGVVLRTLQEAKQK